MPGPLAMLGLKLAGDVAGSAIGAGMGMLLEKRNDKRQLEQQRKLTAMQLEANKDMAMFNHKNAMQMWNETNYGAQVEHLKAAGLNPGLLYGKGGGGGTTTAGAATGGGVGMATATPGGGEIMGMMMQRMQMEMMNAQKENIQADTEKKEAETAKTAGVDTREAETRIINLTQGVENAKAVEQLTKAQTAVQQAAAKIQTETIDEQIGTIEQGYDQAFRNVEAAEIANDINRSTADDKIKMVRAELLGAWLENALTKAQTTNVKQGTEESKSRVNVQNSQIQVNEQSIRASATGIVQKWQEIEYSGGRMNNETRGRQHNEFIKDVSESTRIGTDVIEKVLQALAFKGSIK